MGGLAPRVRAASRRHCDVTRAWPSSAVFASFLIKHNVLYNIVSLADSMPQLNSWPLLSLPRHLHPLGHALRILVYNSPWNPLSHHLDHEDIRPRQLLYIEYQLLIIIFIFVVSIKSTGLTQNAFVTLFALSYLRSFALHIHFTSKLRYSSSHSLRFQPTTYSSKNPSTLSSRCWRCS